MRKCMAFLLCLVLLTGCARVPAETTPTFENTLELEPVENLSPDFLLAMDASSVIACEESGVTYYGFDGQPQDVFKTLAQAGIHAIRVRIWNDPFDAKGNGYGGGNCNLDTALAIGRRAAEYGMGLIVDFHYSDFWADPGKQQAPKAWKGLTLEEKAQALKGYTRRSLEALKEAGIPVVMVQLGNETNGQMCGESSWESLAVLWNAGAKAVRETCPEARIALHFTNPEKPGLYADYASHLTQVDYDVFATSYYPYWHGSLDNLRAVLTDIHETCGKQVMVMETAYGYTSEDSDFYPNNVSEPADTHPFTIKGQAEAILDVIEAVANTPGGIGVCYWEGAWISVGGASRDENSKLWESYGSGWASSWAGSYDPEDAGQYFGGCGWDNQALFDPQGQPLPSLLAFWFAQFGNRTGTMEQNWKRFC